MSVEKASKDDKNVDLLTKYANYCKRKLEIYNDFSRTWSSLNMIIHLQATTAIIIFIPHMEQFGEMKKKMNENIVDTNLINK